jgi:hypothetical protein
MTEWRKSTRSGYQSNCVELAVHPDLTMIRDSKMPTAGRLTLHPAPWSAFLSAIKR